MSITGGDGADQLVATSAGSDFTVSLIDRGSVDTDGSVSTFNGIGTLIGNAGNDSFTFVNSGSLSGLVNGASGNDTIIGDNNGNIFNVTSSNAGTLAGKITGGFQNVENLNGGDIDDVFDIDAALSGNIVAGGGADVVDIADTVSIGGSIITGQQSDSVTIGDLVTINGLIDTGAGDDNLNITARFTGDADTGADNDQITLSATGVVTGTVGGGTGADTLNGGDVATTYIVSGLDSGSLASRITSFNGIENLNGGTLADTFQFQTGGTLTSGTIDGGVGTGDRLQGDLQENLFVITGTDAGTC